jgi:hypothetical protein
MVTHRERIMIDSSTRRLLSGCAAVLAFGTWYSVNAPHDWQALDRAGYDTELPLERVAVDEDAMRAASSPQR